MHVVITAPNWTREDAVALARELRETYDESLEISTCTQSGAEITAVKGEVKGALEGDSNDAERDALVSVAELLHIDYTPPED